jgi:hypothetical protein
MRIAHLPVLVACASTLVVASGCRERRATPKPASPSAAVRAAADASTAQEATTTVKVFFLDQKRMETGEEPLFVPVERKVPAGTAPQSALEALFAGPTAQEKARGLRFVDSEAKGFADLRIEGGVAHVRLVGGCNSGGSTVSIANEIGETLMQFPQVQHVKVYDPEGRTQQPDEPVGSIPFCLEP